MKYLLISSQRSGSVFLERSLNSHPEIRCHGEVLLGLSGPTAASTPVILNRHRRARLAYSKVLSGAALRPAAVLEAALSDGGEAAIGSRVMYSQMNRRVDRYLSAHPEIALLHLQRRDLLRQSISRHIMWHRQRSLGKGSAHVGASVEMAPIQLSPSSVVRVIEKNVSDRNAFLDRYGADVALSLTYETLTGAEGELDANVGRSICRTLGVRYQSMSSTTRRTTEQGLDEVVSNFSEVCDALHDAGLSHLVGSSTGVR